MEIYSIARRFMFEHGNPNQWGKTNWPPEALIYDDIRAKKSYVCLNAKSKIVGTFFYDYGNDIEPTYKNPEGGMWRDKSPFGVVHRLASDGSEKGVGSFCLSWAFEQSHHVKVDTHEDNIVMQSLLKKLGFERIGIIHVVEDNDPRVAYEKLSYGETD